MQRIDSGPVGPGRHQEADGNGRDKPPKHFVRMPGYSLQRCGQDFGSVDPDADRDRGPCRAREIERSECEFQERVQTRRHAWR